jgi:DNA-directed RNA polymerases I, II, and III subunit RPABC1
MTKDGLNRAIGVHRSPLTPSATKHLHETSATYKIHMFQERELVINVTKHILVPRHEILSTREKEGVIQK